MRLKKIELLGFKSFCDRTVVHFDENISAVVGPNGCGKSNIVDAIRWVLGEKSAKHLRGRSMEDLIFAGAENRGPMGMAEVSLTLDLTDGKAPVRYLDYPEITVTRRIFRDGTSEYLIQKVPCRLKDITEIFLGTGVHNKAYSIIEQGRIGFILSSKPEERRVLIEEAAGITKYKGKKKAAERRMKSTKQNLLRVNDIVAELEKRLGSLRRQARKAERYEGYQAEFKDLDLRRAAHKYLELTVTRGFVTSQLSEIVKECGDLGTSAETLEAQLDTERLSLAEAETQLNSLQEKIYEVENAIRLLENECNYKDTERRRLKGEMERASADITRLKEEMEALASEIKVRGEELEQLAIGLEARRKDLEESVSDAEVVRGDLEVCRGDLEEARSAASEHAKAAASCESRVETGSQHLDELVERLETLDYENERLEEESSVLSPRRGELEERFHRERQSLDEKKGRKERLVKHVGSLREQHNDSEIRLETARTQLQRCHSRLSSLEEIQKRYEGFEQGTKAVMERYNGDAREAGIRGLVADILTSPADLEPAVEAVLGDRLGNILVENQDVGVEAVEFLKEGRRGRSSFIPVKMEPRGDEVMRAAGGGGERAGGEVQVAAGENVRGELTSLVEISEGYDDVARYLLGDVVVVDDLKSALNLWQTGRLFKKLVTMDGEIVDTGGVITGGSIDDKTAGILGQKREIRELRRMARKLEKVERQSLARHMAIKAELGATERELEALVDELHAADKALYACERDLDEATQRTRELDRRLMEATNERLRVSEALRREREEVESAKVRGETHSKELARREEEVRVLSARVQELTQSAERANAVVTELKVSVAQGGERIEALRAQLERARDSRRYAEERVENLLQSIEDSSRKRDELAAEIAEAKKKAADKASEAGDLGDKLAKLRTECERHRLAAGEIEAKLKGVRRELSRVNEMRSETEMAVQRLDMEGEHLREDVEKRHHVTPDQVVVDHHLERPWDEELEARLEELDGYLERMRAYYNPTARREFEELSERHEFLTGQRADLEEALERLSKAIQKINRTSRKRFKETFDAINERFQAVFPRLFQGGKASLLLTEADDILDAGVEIAAQPPGKKPQTVGLLSGGEKALTAVSLIFAIFLHHPSPFCILDEVDAPLDEANVDRYNALVREIGLYTQFILVTHNKRTMEMVDGLYGVTMDEPGVSRIVQVNLKEAARLAA